MAASAMLRALRRRELSPPSLCSRLRSVLYGREPKGKRASHGCNQVNQAFTLLSSGKQRVLLNGIDPRNDARLEQKMQD